MTKDILTREKIKQDYNHNSFRDTIPLIIIPTVLLLPIVGLIVAIMSFEKNNDMIGYLLVCFLGLFLILLLLLVATLCIASFIKARKNYRTIENDEFEVISDRLIDTEEKRVGSRSRLGEPYALEFSSYGNYAIPSGENYHSSENYSMSDQGVFYNAKVGDTFYLVVDKNQRILLAYNTKFFFKPEFPKPLN